MPNVPRVGDLEKPEDLVYQRREWAFQRVGWVVMALVALAGLLGLLGHGPLSNTSATDPGGALRVEYSRFIHYGDPDQLEVHIGPGAGSKGELRLWLNSEYLAGVQVEKVTPEPERVEAGADRHTFVFRVSDVSRPTRLTLRVQAQRYGLRRAWVGLEGREPAPFWQFVYP
jgi:hypothetical protein